MTERLADITARIEGIKQLGAVVNAMRGIAAARAQHARGELKAVDSYAAIISAAISRTLALEDQATEAETDGGTGRAIIVFCAEQGFAGAFSEQVLDAVKSDIGKSLLFLIGTRGYAIAHERGIETTWHAAMPSQSQNTPRLADQIAKALYDRIATGEIAELEAVFMQWQPGQNGEVIRRPLFPLDMSVFEPSAHADKPLTYLPAPVLLDQLTANYIHSRLCHAALHAFAAENEARMEAMAKARNQIDRNLGELQAQQRLVRQEEITSEIIELATGEMASRRQDGEQPN